MSDRRIYKSGVLAVYQQRDWGPGMVKCVGSTRAPIFKTS